MKKVLVIVPFQMSDDNRALRSAQVNAVELGPDIRFDARVAQRGEQAAKGENDETIPLPVDRRPGRVVPAACRASRAARVRNARLRDLSQAIR